MVTGLDFPNVAGAGDTSRCSSLHVTSAELKVKRVALAPLLPVLPEAIQPSSDAGHTLHTAARLLERCLTGPAAFLGVDLDVPFTRVEAPLAR